MTNTRRLLTAAMAGALLLAACGDDDDSSDTPAATEAPVEATAAPEPATTEAMTDEEMDEEVADEEMADEEVAGPATGVLVDELTAAGLGADEAQCVVDAASDEWGADALFAPGKATDSQLVRLAEITFECTT